MVQDGDEHGGHSVERGAAFLLDGGHRRDRVEALHDDQGCPVVHRSQDPQHAAEAVKERHGQADPVFRTEVLVGADPIAVVADVEVRQHDALGEPRGARGVLHVDDVVRVEGGLAGPVIAVAGHGAHGQDLRDGIHPAVLFQAQEKDPLQVRKTGARQAPPFLGPQLGDELIYGLQVIDVLVAVDEKQVFRLRLFQNIGQLVDPVVGVDGEQDGADLGGGELQRHPIGDVGRPHGHLFALLDTHRHQAAGQAIHEIAELPVGQTEIPVDIDHRLVVRVGGDGPVQNLPQCPRPQYLVAHGASFDRQSGK